MVVPCDGHCHDVWLLRESTRWVSIPHVLASVACQLAHVPWLFLATRALKSHRNSDIYGSHSATVGFSWRLRLPRSRAADCCALLLYRARPIAAHSDNTSTRHPSGAEPFVCRSVASARSRGCARNIFFEHRASPLWTRTAVCCALLLSNASGHGPDTGSEKPASLFYEFLLFLLHSLIREERGK